MQALIPDINNFNKDREESKNLQKLLDVRSGAVERPKLSSQPKYKSQRDRELFGPQENRKLTAGGGGRKNMKRQ